MKTSKKVTLATIKAFIRKNSDNLLILTKSRFDGMTDGCESTGQIGFVKVSKTESNISHTLGIQGAWFVGQSRDYFVPFERDGVKGFEVSNACGHFEIAIGA
jgi:hypothetical protein